MRRGIYTFRRGFASKTPRDVYDAIVVGGGHNGLTAAAYLARAGKRVCVLERREVLGGAAVTEEIVPGFKFSRASYLLSLIRPIVIKDLNLKDHGLRHHIRNPSSFTPVRNSKDSLLLGLDMQENCNEIGKFSKRDAEAFPKYEAFIERIVRPLEPMMDEVPIDIQHSSKWELFLKSWKVIRRGEQNIGSTVYVLLHHVLGGMDNRSGTWAYVIGGMGAVSSAIAKSAQNHGAEIFTEQEVDTILVENSAVQGIRLSNGKEIHAGIVLSNATPRVTFEKLIDQNIFHGSMSLDQLYFTRPISHHSNYRTPIRGLFLCGSGAHPGGGVTGAPGRLGAHVALQG
ncbi:hypothetical protein NECAME_17076 [Necator americanus]|uniref:FAD dependent oxidoreductase n=1 Tax=Necator americanus TaxID=51031 RepID=W2TS10_NECAM|nr:hypothetical protein NECAME_17076 [Necator americanus]ETN84613.1 hypothetical protein NECAME_17076 [Necator americanus]